MAYKIFVTDNARDSVHAILDYLSTSKKNPQAAAAVLSDFRVTSSLLKTIAGSIRFCENPRLKEKGYKKIHFLRHKYFLVFHIIEENVFIDFVFHDLQDYESKIR